MILNKVIPPSTQELVGAAGIGKSAAADWKKYTQACIRRSNLVGDVLDSCYGSVTKMKVLDWGSSVGGVAALVAEKYPVEMHAADVDEYSLRWLGNNFHNIKTHQLEPENMLPFSDAAFDFIYGISIFTHIPPEVQEFYLCELRRILKPNCYMLLTVKSYTNCEFNRRGNRNPEVHPHSKEKLRSEGVIYTSYPDSVKAQMDFARNSDFGLTYLSHEYILSVYSKYFFIEEIKAGGLGSQDSIVLRKSLE